MTDATQFNASSTPDQADTAQLVHDAVVKWLRTEAGIQVDEVDHDASLFELGIDSLGAASIGSELETATNKRLNPEVVFELETINELAEYLDSLQPSEPKLLRWARKQTRPVRRTRLRIHPSSQLVT